MTFELTNNQWGRVIVKDADRHIELEEFAGRPNEGFAFYFTYKEKKMRLKVDSEGLTKMHVRELQDFPEELEEEKQHIIELIKASFEFLRQYNTEKANAEFTTTYSLS